MIINDWNLVYPGSKPVQIDNNDALVLVQEYIGGHRIYLCADVPKSMYASEALHLFSKFPNTMFAWKYIEFGPDIPLSPVNELDVYHGV